MSALFQRAAVILFRTLLHYAQTVIAKHMIK